MSILYLCQSHPGLTRWLEAICVKEYFEWEEGRFMMYFQLSYRICMLAFLGHRVSLLQNCFAKALNISWSHWLLLRLEIIPFDISSRKLETISKRE